MTECVCGYNVFTHLARHKKTCKVLKYVMIMQDEHTELQQTNLSLQNLLLAKITEIEDLKRLISLYDRTEVERLRKLLRDNPPPRPKMLPQRRLRLAANQGWTCKICKTMLNEAFQVDHIEPWSKTFNDDDSNLQVLCGPCHLAKTSVENSTQ